MTHFQEKTGAIDSRKKSFLALSNSVSQKCPNFAAVTKQRREGGKTTKKGEKARGCRFYQRMFKR